MIGAVAARREALAWLERRPLHGRTVVVTRARAQASGLAATLRGLGATVVELPAIRIESRIDTDEVRAAATAIGDYDLVCLTSPNGVEPALRGARRGRARRAGAGRARRSPRSAPAPPGRSPRTGSPPTSSPSASSPRRWSKRWPSVEVEGKRVLVARAAEARDVLPDALRERGGEVDVVALYETVREAPDDDAIVAAQGADYVTFTSSSTVTNLTEALGDRFPAAAGSSRSAR